MKIPHYWVKSRYEGEDKKGRACTFIASGWSFASLEEAHKEASARAKRIFDLIASGQKPERYEYHDRPIKEERLKEIGDADSPIAVVTRNRYGALILNCANALFVDVDFPRPQANGLLDAIMLAFSGKKRKARQQAVVQKKIEMVEEWAGRHPGRSFRLYRTREGLRLLFTDRQYDPTAHDTATTLSELDADPLYVTLTQKQECFRARLTSKPWRCGSSRPPNSFPWDSTDAEAKFRKWEADYTRLDAGFKVCDLIREFGTPANIESLKTIVDVHDRGVRVDAEAELA
ncbi:MAG: hypothetical protein FJ224_11030 [Lentisphaerae bacterium]|nr:hypothetical protein [Lentisphaerota bacterium]